MVEQETLADEGVAHANVTERAMFRQGKRAGMAAALDLLREEIGAYRAMEDVAPTRVAKLYAANCREVLQAVAEKIRRL